MKTQSGLMKPQQTLEVVRAKRLPGTTVAAWEGETSTGELVHLSYHPEELRVMVARPTATGRTWKTVVRCHPRLIEAEDTVARWEERETWLRKLEGEAARRALQREAAQLRQRLWVEAQGQLRASPRSWDTGRAAKVNLATVRGLLEARDVQRTRLAKVGWLGGETRVVMHAWIEQPPGGE